MYGPLTISPWKFCFFSAPWSPPEALLLRSCSRDSIAQAGSLAYTSFIPSPKYSSILILHLPSSP